MSSRLVIASVLALAMSSSVNRSEACKFSLRVPLIHDVHSNPTIVLVDVEPHSVINVTSNGRVVRHRATSIDRHLRLDVELAEGPLRVDLESPEGRVVTHHFRVQSRSFEMTEVAVSVGETHIDIRSSAILYRIDWEDGHVAYSPAAAFALDRDQLYRVVGLFSDGVERTLIERTKPQP